MHGELWDDLVGVVGVSWLAAAALGGAIVWIKRAHTTQHVPSPDKNNVETVA